MIFVTLPKGRIVLYCIIAAPIGAQKNPQRNKYHSAAYLSDNVIRSSEIAFSHHFDRVFLHACLHFWPTPDGQIS